MAITSIAAPLSGIRGKLGGIIFSANGTGTFVKGWARPVDPKSGIQSSRRSLWSGYPLGWRSLSAAQRTAWDTFAANIAQQLTNSLGETYFASGFNWFLRDSLVADVHGWGPVSVAPVVARPAIPAITSVTCKASAGGRFLKINYMSGEFSGKRLIAFAAVGPSEGALRRFNNWKIWGGTSSPGMTSQDILAIVEQKFGPLVAGMRISVRTYAWVPNADRSGEDIHSCVAF